MPTSGEAATTEAPLGYFFFFGAAFFGAAFFAAGLAVFFAAGFFAQGMVFPLSN